METRKTKLGVDHPSTLITMNNLAFTWKAKGWDTEARRLMSDCVQRRSCILGVQHPGYQYLSSCVALTDWQATDIGTDGSN